MILIKRQRNTVFKDKWKYRIVHDWIRKSNLHIWDKVLPETVLTCSLAYADPWSQYISHRDKNTPLCRKRNKAKSGDVWRSLSLAPAQILAVAQRNRPGLPSDFLTEVKLVGDEQNSFRDLLLFWGQWKNSDGSSFFGAEGETIQDMFWGIFHTILAPDVID